MSFEFLKTPYNLAIATLAELDWARILISGAIIVIVTTIRGTLARSSLNLLSMILRQFDISFAKSFRVTIQPATEMLVFSLGLIAALGLAQPPGPIGVVFERFAMSFLVASLFYGAYASCHLGAGLLHGRSPHNETMSAAWLERILRVAAVTLGVVSVLRVWGMDLGPMLTGVGIAGAAAALAAQDLFKNFVGGMSNMAEKRFKVGDWIRAEGVVEGIVEDIALRSTAVRQFDMSLVHVPNGDLANAPLINVSTMRHRRISMTAKLHYGTSVEQLSRITGAIKAYIAKGPPFVQPPEASQYVRIDDFSETSIDLLIYCFTLSTSFDDYLNAKEGLIFEIMGAVADAGAQFSHESQTFFIEYAADNGARESDSAAQPSVVELG